jgi:hypothetical protein
VGFVQDFSFETYRVDALPPMLEAAIRAVITPHADPGSLRVQTEEIEYHACPAIPLAMYCYFERHPQDMTGYVPSMEAYSVEKDGTWRRKPPFYEPICTIAGSNVREPPFVHSSVACLDEAAAVAAAMAIVKAADPKTFVAKCGAYGPYQGCEGTVLPGYRIALAGWGVMALTVSFCHYYAPK